MMSANRSTHKVTADNRVGLRYQQKNMTWLADRKLIQNLEKTANCLTLDSVPEGQIAVYACMRLPDTKM